jgi:uncharacterized membrane protein YqaE (UPF0057 family)
MSAGQLWRVVLAVLFPPFAVADHGCGTMLLVGVLTLMGWFPGMIVALLIVLLGKPPLPSASDVRAFSVGDRRFVQIPNVQSAETVRGVQVPDADTQIDDEDVLEKPKRDARYIRLADGEMAEVVDDDGAPLEKPKRRQK